MKTIINFPHAELTEALRTESHNQRYGTGSGVYCAGLLLVAIDVIQEQEAKIANLGVSVARQLRGGREDEGDDVDEDEGDEAPPAAAPAPASRCRHQWQFNTKEIDGRLVPFEVCSKCGAPKKKQGRPSNASKGLATVEGVTKADPPTVPLPEPPKAAAAPMGPDAANKFSGGTVG